LRRLKRLMRWPTRPKAHPTGRIGKRPQKNGGGSLKPLRRCGNPRDLPRLCVSQLPLLQATPLAPRLRRLGPSEHHQPKACAWLKAPNEGANVPAKSIMATNALAGDGHRNGAVRKRTQFKAEVGHYTERGKKDGLFMAQMKDGGKFKGVRKERAD
jgi:hypothetical protein